MCGRSVEGRPKSTGPTTKWPGEVVCDEENISGDVDNAVIVGDANDETKNGTEDETKKGTENGTGRGYDAVAVGDTVTEAEAETEDKTEDNTEEDDTRVEDTWSASH